MTAKTIAIIGAGDRGAYFARLIEQNDPPGKVVAVAEPRDDSRIIANAQESLKTHAIVFAAEQSRREGRVVQL